MFKIHRHLYDAEPKNGENGVADKQHEPAKRKAKGKKKKDKQEKV